jgi:methyl-accepting chemotaxis protein
MHDITVASRDQGQGIDQLNEAMAGLDAITRQNAALVEQSAAASASLADEAGELVQALSVFQLAGEPTPTARRTRPDLMQVKDFAYQHQ